MLWYDKFMIHLHTQSAYSLLHSPIRIEQLVRKAAMLNKRCVALTDHNVLFGVPAFLRACKQYQIKPIIGIDTEIKFEDVDLGLVLLAKTNLGLQALYAMSTLCSTRKLTIEDLRLYQKDVIVMTSGIDDGIQKALENDEDAKLIHYLKSLKDASENFYVSIAMNDSEYRSKLNIVLKDTANRLDIQTCALSRILYLEPEEVNDLKILRAIDKQKPVTDPSLDVAYQRFFRNDEQMSRLYAREDLEMSDQIAAQCHLQEPFEKSTLPIFENKLGIDSETFLIKLCKAGLLKRMNGKVPNAYVQRLEYELDVITTMGFTDYFLIVYDMIRYARSKQILVGPGRGSAAGSLVAYCLGITHIDPIENDLLFERFLNPARISMPDIDTDFPDDRREEVVQYLIEKYGQDHVSQIITFSNLKAKQVLRDVGKALGYLPREIDQITRLIPSIQGIPMTLQGAYDGVPNFYKMVNSNKKWKILYEQAKRLEGLPRHTSVHAAGIVLSRRPIVEVCPLYHIEGSIQATQYTMENLEPLGLIKMDVLALRNLTTIDRILQEIKKELHQEIDIFKIPKDDQKTYELLSQADTVGVFQFEGDGIKSLLRKVRPHTFADISVTLALYRPGPMENIPLYLKQRDHPETIHYLHPALRPILQETYGVMIYQEQIMQVAQQIGKMSLSQADTLRKAMSKKNKEVMDSYKQTFIEGAMSQNISENIAEQIFSIMEQFAKYGFNKSHSYAYSSVAYIMAYLKANYPLYFYQSLLGSVIGTTEKSAEYIFECAKRHVRVLPASIIHSQETYVIEHGALRMPLQMLKGIGKSIYPKIIEERNKKPFEDVFECFARLNAIKIREATILTLIDGGAFDEFGISRATLRNNLSQIWNYASLVKVEDKDSIHFNFEIASRPKLIKYADHPLEKAQKEKEVYGFYLSEHPIRTLRRKRFMLVPTLNILEDQLGYVQCLVRVVRVKPHKTKRGDMMAFVTVEDETKSGEIVIMPKLYDMVKDELKAGALVIVDGKKEKADSILANKMKFVTLDNE
ncbi:DNA polymerase III, alpha subunit [Firmicutes bacterium M10-2]|nr:DNA polymerase III, alpha subunit [Firmicutes bacterium M10-2]